MYRYIHYEGITNLFIFSGISTVVITRVFLHLTGYPQIGSHSGLHIAHVLFGGLLMMVSLMLLFTFISHIRFLLMNAVIGGVGFGLFIDEVGKFVTKDVNYFYKPAFVIMYVIFISIFLLFHLLQRYAVSQNELFLNSIESLKEAFLGNINTPKQQQALLYLTQCTAEPSLVPSMASYFSSLSPSPSSLGLKEKAKSYLYGMMDKKWFSVLLTVFFLSEAFVLILITIMFALSDGVIDITESIMIGTCVLRIVLILSGILFLARLPKRTYILFWYTTLLSITIMELFRLYDEPVYALYWLLIDGGLLLVLHYLINREQWVRYKI
jgi:hypothetical protein